LCFVSYIPAQLASPETEYHQGLSSIAVVNMHRLP
jgi:hypothetical protein